MGLILNVFGLKTVTMLQDGLKTEVILREYLKSYNL